MPKEWADKYKGQFDQGWDKLREETLARQKALGVVPPDAELSKRHEEIPAWDDMPDALKPVLARQMEVYAGMLEHVDYHLGRLIDALADLEILDDTLIYYIIGDNGAAAEGTINGAFNEMSTFNGMAALETPEFMVARIDEFGAPASYNHYSVGWAHAMDTPYQWTKQVASHWGGTRNGTIVHWPNGIKSKGEVRSQFHHVIDLTPMILEAAGLPQPIFVHGVQQRPIEGVSMFHSFNDASAPDQHETQYDELRVLEPLLQLRPVSLDPPGGSNAGSRGLLPLRCLRRPGEPGQVPLQRGPWGQGHGPRASPRHVRPRLVVRRAERQAHPDAQTVSQSRAQARARGGAVLQRRSDALAVRDAGPPDRPVGPEQRPRAGAAAQAGRHGDHRRAPGLHAVLTASLHPVAIDGGLRGEDRR